MLHWKKMFITAFLGMSFTSTLAAAQCDMGRTVARDALYGAGLGVLGGSLYLLADSKDVEASDIVPTLGITGLVGLGIGGAIGVAEASICANSSAEIKEGWQQPTFFTSLLNSEQYNSSKKQASYGLSLSYFFK